MTLEMEWRKYPRFCFGEFAISGGKCFLKHSTRKERR